MATRETGSLLQNENNHLLRLVFALTALVLTFVTLQLASIKAYHAQRRYHEEQMLEDSMLSNQVIAPFQPGSNDGSSIESNSDEHIDSYALLNEVIRSNPFQLSETEIADQYQSAKIPSLKSRVKRFACWHSCFGQFRKKAFRMPFGKSALSVTSAPISPVSPSDSGNAPDQIGTNELGDGENNKTGKRSKKSPLITDYFNLKTRIVPEREVGSAQRLADTVKAERIATLYASYEDDTTTASHPKSFPKTSTTSTSTEAPSSQSPTQVQEPKREASPYSNEVQVPEYKDTVKIERVTHLTISTQSHEDEGESGQETEEESGSDSTEAEDDTSVEEEESKEEEKQNEQKGKED